MVPSNELRGDVLVTVDHRLEPDATESISVAVVDTLDDASVSELYRAVFAAAGSICWFIEKTEVGSSRMCSLAQV